MSDFLSKLTGDLESTAPPPKGMKRVTPREKGMHFAAKDDHLNHRKIGLRPDSSPEGMALWERRSQATHARLEAEGDAILVLSIQGFKQGMPDFEEKFAAWKAGELELPTLAQTLGMKNPNNASGIVKHAERRETNQQLEDRLQRQRREKAEGVRLERPGIIRTIGR